MSVLVISQHLNQIISNNADLSDFLNIWKFSDNLKPANNRKDFSNLKIYIKINKIRFIEQIIIFDFLFFIFTY